MLLEQNNIPFGPLAKIGNIVEKLCQQNDQALPNISHEIPLTHLSKIEHINAASKIGALNDETVLKSLQIKENIAEGIRLTPLLDIHSNVPNANVHNMLPLRISTECESTDDIESVRAIRDDSLIKLKSESNKENQNTIRDAKASESTLSTIVPQFQPITISSERMKVLSQSIVEVNAEVKETSNQKILSKCKPKVVVKHIVLKRE